jgi:hypothetical protein
MELEQENLALQQRSAKARRRQSLHDTHGDSERRSSLTQSAHHTRRSRAEQASLDAAAAVAVAEESSSMTRSKRSQFVALGGKTAANINSSNSANTTTAAPNSSSSSQSFPRKFLSRIGRRKHNSIMATSLSDSQSLSRIPDLEEERKKRVASVRHIESPDPFRSSLQTIERRKLVLYHKDTLLDLRAAAKASPDSSLQDSVSNNSNSSEPSADAAATSPADMLEVYNPALAAKRKLATSSSSCESDSSSCSNNSRGAGGSRPPPTVSKSATTPELSEVYNPQMAAAVLESNKPNSSKLSNLSKSVTSAEMSQVYNPPTAASLALNRPLLQSSPGAIQTKPIVDSSSHTLARTPAATANSKPDQLAAVYNPPPLVKSPRKLQLAVSKSAATTTSDMVDVYNPQLAATPSLPVTDHELSEVYNPDMPPASNMSTAPVHRFPTSKPTTSAVFKPKPKPTTTTTTPPPSANQLVEVYNPQLAGDAQSSSELAEVYNPDMSFAPAPTVKVTTTAAKLHKFPSSKPLPTKMALAGAPKRSTAPPTTSELVDVYNPQLCTDDAPDESEMADVYNPPIQVGMPKSVDSDGPSTNDMVDVYNPDLSNNEQVSSGTTSIPSTSVRITHSTASSKSPSLQASDGSSSPVTAPLALSLSTLPSMPPLSASVNSAPPAPLGGAGRGKRSPIFRPNAIPRAVQSANLLQVNKSVDSSATKHALSSVASSSAVPMTVTPTPPPVTDAYGRKIQASNEAMYDDLPSMSQGESRAAPRISANWNERYQTIISIIETFDINTSSHDVQDAYLSLIALAQVLYLLVSLTHSLSLSLTH